MEHFGDQQEQVSISIDTKEIPDLDFEDDSLSSLLFNEFEIFISNGLTRVQEGSRCYQVITGAIAAQGMENVAAVHKIPRSGPNGRLEAFRISSAEMAEKCGGNGNMKLAWFTGSKEEICEIICRGFQSSRKSENEEDGFGIHLFPLEFFMDGFVSSLEDENGLRHLLLCNVILGNMEEVRSGSKQFRPSLNEFDSGVDDLVKPTRFTVWEAYMNSRIFPNYVVSFRALNVRGFGRDQSLVYKPTTQFVGFSLLIPKLANVLHLVQMELLRKYFSEFHRKKISRGQLINRLRQFAGDELLKDVIQFYNNKHLEARSRSSASADQK